MGQRAGQKDIARNKETGMEIYRQKVRGRVEDRENKRKVTGRGAEVEKETLETERRRVTGQKQRDRERKKKSVMGSKPEGPGKTGGRTKR